MHPPLPARARIDLHTHSDRSDGTDSPEQVVAAAAAAGLDVVALTDHDVICDPVPSAAGLVVMPGVEISCVDAAGVSLHLLGYLVDPADAALRADLARLRDSRVSRARRLVALLAADGVAITWEAVSAAAGSGTVGRPHVAQALLDAGAVATLDEAFTPRWLGPGTRYRVPREELGAVTAVHRIRAAGGVAVLAHPLAGARGRVVGEATVAAMAAAGLAGLEVDHPDHPPAARDAAAALARRHGLLATGSSDYHGARRPQAPGAGLTAPEVFAALLERASPAGRDRLVGPQAGRP